MEKGILYLVATPIGNLDDITYRAINTLKEVDIILAEDTRKTLKLLNHFEISKKLISFYRHNEGIKLDYVLDLLNDGKNLAVVSDAGTPGISDPGEDLVRACIEQNIKVIPIPGACAFVQGLICSGFDTTRFVFEGFLPMNKKGRRQRLEKLKDETRTIILYEAPHKLKYTLDDLKTYFGGDRNITLARELTKIHEEFLRFSIDDAISYFDENDIKGEFVVLIEGTKEDVSNEIAPESVKELMDNLLKEGIDKKEAMKIVAEKKKMRKSDVYKELLK